MVQRIRAAVDARHDPNFVICARTDARGPEGLDAAIERARAYVAAGADMIFPEALADEHEFAAMRAAVQVALLANMTEFGKSRLLDTATLEGLGVNVVIYPVTTLRLAMGAVEAGLTAISRDGTQESLVPQMQTRARLYDLIGYADYREFDDGVLRSTLSHGGIA
jgi:methylisocitrate lyase